MDLAAGRDGGVPSSSWIQRLAREFQLLAGHLAFSDDAEVGRALEAAVHRIRVRTNIDRQMVAGLLAQVVLRWQIRRHSPPAEANCCLAAVDEWLPRTVRDRLGLSAPIPYDRTRSAATLAERAKLLIDQRYAEPLCGATLSRGVGSSRRRLEREFKSSYGDTLHHYLLLYALVTPSSCSPTRISRSRL
jgi:hypothetical protein